MRSRTYAYNGIILGILFGMAAGAYTESIPIGVIVAILGSVICFLIIRFLENLLGRGIDKATDAVANQFAKRGQKSTLQSGNRQIASSLLRSLNPLPRKPAPFAQNVVLQ